MTRPSPGPLLFLLLLLSVVSLSPLSCALSSLSRNGGASILQSGMPGRKLLGSGDDVAVTLHGRRLEENWLSREMVWYPWDKRYLLALCLNGGLSEQLHCMKSSFYLAGILNRTLLVPTVAVAYHKETQLPLWQWGQVVDFARMRGCLEDKCGPKTVFLVPEFLALAKQQKVTVTKIHCAVPGAPPVTSCYHQRPANAIQDACKETIELPHATQDTVVPSPLEGGRMVTVDEVVKAFGALPDEVLCVGDVGQLMLQNPGGVMSQPSPTPACTNMWRPHPAIMSFVDGILDTLLGSQYAAVYWKRGQEPRASPADDELPKHVPAVPVAEVAARLRKKLAATDVSVLYVATDAKKAEIATFESLLKDASTGKRFAAILSLRQILEDEEWLLQQFWSKDALLMEKNLKNGVALALTDKFVCARAKYFLGTDGSKFSNDILEIRKNEGLQNPEGMGDVF